MYVRLFCTLDCILNQIKNVPWCLRIKSKGRTLWWSGAGTQRNILTGPRRTLLDPTSSRMMECRKSSMLSLHFLTWIQMKPCYCCSFPSIFHCRLVSHFYGHGDVCDLTGKPRQVIVKLKWVNSTGSVSLPRVNAWVRQYPDVSRWFTHLISLLSVRCKESESPHAVTVYMLEPQTCQYILGVGSLVNSESQSLKKVLHSTMMTFTSVLNEWVNELNVILNYNLFIMHLHPSSSGCIWLVGKVWGET